MASFGAANIRNIALIGHGSAGKTSLSEAMLFDTGATMRRGRVEDGTTVSDWDDEESRRRLSVNVSVLPCEWRGHKVNVLDTPGFIDFVGETRGALAVADATLVVIDAVAGIEVGTELTWGYAEDAGLPRTVFINKMDRENARFSALLQNLRDAFGGTIVPAQLPIGGEGSEFRGIVRPDHPECLHRRECGGQRSAGANGRRGGDSPHAAHRGFRGR